MLFPRKLLYDHANQQNVVLASSFCKVSALMCNNFNNAQLSTNVFFLSQITHFQNTQLQHALFLDVNRAHAQGTRYDA